MTAEPLIHHLQQRFANSQFAALMLLLAAISGVVIAKGGLMAGLLLAALPAALFLMGALLSRPSFGLTSSLLVGFAASGLARYVNMPWGMLLDFFLVVSWIALAAKRPDWSPLRNTEMAITLMWYIFVVLEVANPESTGVVSWFYAMRNAGFYQLLVFGLVYMTFREARQMNFFLNAIGILSVLGTLWGFRQLVTGLDEAEWRWLYLEGNAMTHILHGKLRAFSFYSDAGQFGASQAMVSLVFAIMALAPVSPTRRIWYVVVALVTLVGFAISGTRGALFVPAAGAIGYLVISRNFKVLVLGLMVLGIAFFFLKYTFAFQHVEQIRRMRTALNPEDPSMLVRYNNQITFGKYLQNRPFGGGIGAAGFWGARFNPNSLLARTPTDSYYVKVWVETGIVGICLHLLMFGFFIGKGGHIVWHLRDPVLRTKIAALYCGMLGIMFASYGNQVFSQMPTSIIMGIAIPIIFISPKWDGEQAPAIIVDPSQI